MSGIPELIEINKTIVKQNEEIIRLLKKIAGEDDVAKPKILSVADTNVINPIATATVSEDGNVTVAIDEDDSDLLLSNEGQVGEVYFIEAGDIFKLTIENNETTVDNLTGSGETTNFNEQEIVANESIKKNQSLPDSTVILNTEQSTNLPQTLEMCYKFGAKKVFLPWASMTQLIGAPDKLMTIMKLDFYRTEEELITKVFKK